MDYEKIRKYNVAITAKFATSNTSTRYLHHFFAILRKPTRTIMPRELNKQICEKEVGKNLRRDKLRFPHCIEDQEIQP